MAAQRRVVAAQLHAVRVVLAILHRGVRVRALGAAQLDDDAVALLGCHDSRLSLGQSFRHCRLL